MRPFHELIVELADRRQVSPATRRGVLALAAAAMPAALGLEATLAQERKKGKGGNGGGKGNGGGGKDRTKDEKVDRRRRKDVAVLNYALTLEHLENAFYRQGIAKFGAIQGYEFLPDIAAHEKTHVDALTSTIRGLKGKPVTEGCYTFNFTTPQAFVQTAELLEDTGVMAYDGAVAMIRSRALQTTGATIATVEARHASYLRFKNGKNPFPAAFDTPKTKAQILAAAAPFFCR